MGEYIRLNNGHKMPLLGIGTGTLLKGQEEEFIKALDAGLSAGYRLIDAAYLYMNEGAVGKVLEKWLQSGKVKREELFVTKLPFNGMRPDLVAHFLKKSLQNLRLSYVDMYLIHSPIGFQYVSDFDLMPRKDGKPLLDLNTNLEAIWKAMEEQVDAGLAKSIGVSNFNISQIERMVHVARIPPANIQIELHAYVQQKPVQEFCRKHSIVVTAYSPIGAPGRSVRMQQLGFDVKELNLLEDPVVTEIATKLGKTPVQILLRFLIQQEIAAIPRSRNPERLKQNFDVFNFRLSDDDVNALKQLDSGLPGGSIKDTLQELRIHPEFQVDTF